MYSKKYLNQLLKILNFSKKKVIRNSENERKIYFLRILREYETIE